MFKSGWILIVEFLEFDGDEGGWCKKGVKDSSSFCGKVMVVSSFVIVNI